MTIPLVLAKFWWYIMNFDVFQSSENPASHLQLLGDVNINYISFAITVKGSSRYHGINCDIEGLGTQ